MEQGSVKYDQLFSKDTFYGTKVDRGICKTPSLQEFEDTSFLIGTLIPLPKASASDAPQSLHS